MCLLGDGALAAYRIEANFSPSALLANRACRPDLGVLVPLAGHAAHAHSSEATDSGSDDESGGGGSKQHGGTLAALASSTSGGMPLPGKLRAVVGSGGEVELGISKL